MCNCKCKLCPRLIISQAVTFAGGTLTINLPEGSYMDGCKYCLVVAQTIPDAATITAPVVVTIGAGTTEFPLLLCDGAQATANGISTRTKYPTRLATNAASASFRLLRPIQCRTQTTLAAIDGTTPAAPTGGDGA